MNPHMRYLVNPNYKKKPQFQKRFFADNQHHKSQAAIYGKPLKNAADNNAKGDHLFFDPTYKSEYRQCYDEMAKKNLEMYLKDPMANL